MISTSLASRKNKLKKESQRKEKGPTGAVFFRLGAMGPLGKKEPGKKAESRVWSQIEK